MQLYDFAIFHPGSTNSVYFLFHWIWYHAQLELMRVNESRYKTLDRFRSRTWTWTSKTTWKWRVVPMYGYATPFSRRLWRPRPRSKSVCRWESFAFDHQLSSTFNCELVQILTKVDESFQTFTCSKRILGSLSFTFPGTANGRFELSWQNFRWTFSKE
jgi:hypothetical protein